jgi:ABC-type polysaccharide/polyol phosphate export permease
MLSLLSALRGHRDLLFMLTWRDIRIRYKQSVMGLLWALLMPLLIVGAGIIVKGGLAQVSGKQLEPAQLASVTVKALPWAFLVSAIRFGTASLTGNVNLVTKVAFPRSVFPLAATLSALFDFAVASVMVVAVLVFVHLSPSVYLAWVPVLLAILLLQVSGLVLLLSAANLFFRDVKYIVEVVLTFAIFFTPVFYEAEMFKRWSTLLMLNPVAPVFEGLNAAVVLHRSPDTAWTAYAVGWAVFMLLLGPTVFQRLEPRFAESI